MGSQPFDPSCDPFLGFPSEIPIVPTQSFEPSPKVGVWFVAMALVVVGVLAGFVAGYAFAYRPIVSASAPLRISSATSETPRGDHSREAALGPNVVAPAPLTDASAPSDLSTRSSMTRRLTDRRQVPAMMPNTRHAGVIEVLCHPRDAQVLLDGNVVGRAPLSIPDVAEGTHEVRVELAGFSPWVTSVRVKDGSRARVGASLEVERLK